MRKYSEKDIFWLISNGYNVIELPFDFVLVRRYPKLSKNGSGCLYIGSVYKTRLPLYCLHKCEKGWNKLK